jgi:sigma-E factor negative regulatory protein RseB
MIMRGRWLSAAATACLLATVVVTVPGASAGAGTDPEQLLLGARDASSRTTVDGVVEVRWQDGSTVHVDRANARSRDGAYSVGQGRTLAVGLGGLRWSADDGIATLWGRIDGSPPPDPGAAWRLELGGSAEVAGHAAQIVDARHGSGPVRARFYVDEGSGLLLRRDVLARDGDLVRSVRFTQLTTSGARPAVAKVPERREAPVATDEVDSEFAAPDRLDEGFRLLGRYRQPDGVVQLFYGDGLFSISVFEQTGDVDWGSLPDGGRAATIDSERARWYATDAGSVVVWERDGLVLTGVSDAPPDTVRAAVGAVETEGNGVIQDVVDFVLDPFDWQ